MISKTQIDKRLKKKRNPEIVETVLLAKKHGLLDLGKRLSAPASQYTKINLDGLNYATPAGVPSEGKTDKIMVVGKVLGQGEVNRKIKVSALGFSEQAREKLKKAGCEVKSIKDEIESNNKLEGVEVI